MNTPFFSRFLMVLTALFVLHASIDAKNDEKKRGKVTTKHTNGVKASQGKVRNYKKTGTWSYWNDKGQLIQQVSYKNNVLNGIAIDYYDGKQKSSEGNYVDGQKDGAWQQWYKSGKQLSHNFYLKGQYEGLQRSWYENGTLREESIYKYGVLLNRKGWFASGRIRKIENYANGMRNGEWRLYQEEGNDTLPILIEHYQNDKLHGQTIEYRNGRKVTEANYILGKLDGAKRAWELNGNKILEENYTIGLLNGTCSYYDNGVLIREKNYVMSRKHGLFTENNRQGLLLSHTWYTRDFEDSMHTYHANGKVAIRKLNKGIPTTEVYQQYNDFGVLMVNGMSSMGRRLGIWTAYYPNGKKKSETPYEQGKVTGVFRRWHANGKLLIEMECVNGNSVKEPKIWNEAGKPLKRNDKEYIALLESSLPGDIYDDPARYSAPHQRPDVYPVIDEQIFPKEEAIRVVDQEGDYGDVVVENAMPQQNDQIFNFAEEMPVFPGGNEALTNYIQNNLRYPAFEKENGIQGVVYVSLIVRKNGTISDVQVVKGVNNAPAFGGEAVRLISEMPNWIPGKMNGKPVDVRMNLPVRFKLTQ